MTSEKWNLIWRICEAARRLPDAERAAFVRSQAPDPEVERDALSLLQEPQDSVFVSWQSSSGSDAGSGGTAIAAQVLSGARIGRYVVGELLGRGASGDVYSARDTDLERPVAMKFLKPDNARAQWRIDSLLREARAASTLNHPGIVTVHEVIQSESGLAIVMELVDGTVLRRLCGAPNSPDQAIRWSRQIAEALSAAHARGIIHRDIKPENIMARSDGLVKILDFGLAEFFRNEEDRASWLLGGTLRYMSPEQARGEQLTPASDVFSLGLVAYELVTGHYAFPVTGKAPPLQAILTETPIPPSSWNRGIPKALETLILEMLAKAPEARPSAAEVAQRLDRLHHIGIAPRRYWLMATAAALAAALFAGVWFTRQSPQKATPAPLTPLPLTASTGFDSWPDLSPNGDAVAYSWGQSHASYTHLYVKHVDQDVAFQLVVAEPSARVGRPRWSPDGQRIYYKQTSLKANGENIWSISKDGTGQRLVVPLVSAELSSGLDCSADEKRIIFADRPALDRPYVIMSADIATGSKTALTTAPEGYWGDWDPVYSPDGKYIVFKRVKTAGEDQLLVMPAGGGPATPITSQKNSIAGHVWLPGGTILLSSQIGSIIHGLWRISADGSGQPESVYESALDAMMPTIRKNRIAWVNRVNDFNIYSVPIEGGTPVRRIASPTLDSSPAMARDGRLAFVSRRSGSPEVWLTRLDGATPVRVTDLKGDIRNAKWSPDGSRIVFSMRRSGVTTIFQSRCPAGELRCEPPSRLIEGAQPAWSADGTFLYYTPAGNQYQVWRLPLSGGPAVPFGDGLGALPSSDGRWAYFVRNTPAREYYRAPLGADGALAGAAQQVLVRNANSASFENWTVAGDELLFWENDVNSGNSGLLAYHTINKRLRTIVNTSAAESPSVSPDGKTVLFARPDTASGTVMVAGWNR